MRETIEELVAALGARPGRRTRPEWDEVESALGHGLPADYRAFVERVGGGGLNDELFVYEPGAPVAAFDLVEVPRVHAAALDSLRERGLLGRERRRAVATWGHTGEGLNLHWARRGDPEAWTVLIEDPRGALRWEAHRCGFVEFLRQLATGTLRSKMPIELELPVRFRPHARRRRSR
jgi:hypothetical protein